MSSDPTLTVPLGSSRLAASRSGSSTSLRSLVERVDERSDLSTQVRRGISPGPDNTSEVGAGSASDERPLGLKLPAFKAASASDLRSGLASPVIPDGAVQSLISSIHADNPGTKTPVVEDLSVTTLYAGGTHKKFETYTYLLTFKVPYFAKLLANTPKPTPEQLTFTDLNEFAFAIFVRWLYGGRLHGPNDFHSVHHYLCLYVMGHKWDVEPLCNNAVDLIRAYYHVNNMTAPAFRLEYIYAFTDFPNPMRNFLTGTAAYRALCGEAMAKGIYLSDSIKELLKKGGDFPIDFSQACIKLTKNQFPDPRKGSKCDWHEHANGKNCQTEDVEPYMSS